MYQTCVKNVEVYTYINNLQNVFFVKTYVLVNIV